MQKHSQQAPVRNTLITPDRPPTIFHKLPDQDGNLFFVCKWSNGEALVSNYSDKSFLYKAKQTPPMSQEYYTARQMGHALAGDK